MTLAQKYEKNYFDDLSIEKYFLENFKIDIRNKKLESVQEELEKALSRIQVSDQATYAAHSRAHKSAKSAYARLRILYYSAFRQHEAYLRQIELDNKDEERRKEKLNEEKEEKLNFYDLLKSNREVTLYEFEDSNTNINSYAYFEGESLIIDYWILGNNNEIELFTTITKDQLERLYSLIGVSIENRSELLLAISKKFNGKDSYRNIQNYLDQNSITYTESRREDSR